MHRRFFVALAAAATLALVPGAAWAHNPTIEGNVDCGGTLSFTSTAWRGQGEGEALIKSRTNADIRITLHTQDGPDGGVEIAKGHYGVDNDFSFSGTYDLGTITEDVVIKATAMENWANGAAPGEPDKATVKPPTGCTTTTSSSTTSSSTTSSSTSTSSTTTTTQPQETTTTVVPATTVFVPPTTTPPSEGQLPFTGAGTAPMLLSIAAGLLAAGGTAVFFARRRADAEG